jgi:hypothetical protein
MGAEAGISSTVPRVWTLASAYWPLRARHETVLHLALSGANGLVNHGMDDHLNYLYYPKY